jgi:hypothetical protein
VKLLITLIPLNAHIGEERVMHHLNGPNEPRHKEGGPRVSEQEVVEVRGEVHERLSA